MAGYCYIIWMFMCVFSSHMNVYRYFSFITVNLVVVCCLEGKCAKQTYMLRMESVLAVLLRHIVKYSFNLIHQNCNNVLLLLLCIWWYYVWTELGNGAIRISFYLYYSAISGKMRDSLSYFYGRVNGINGMFIFWLQKYNVKYVCIWSHWKFFSRYKWDKKSVSIFFLFLLISNGLFYVEQMNKRLCDICKNEKSHCIFWIHS